jgi:MtN3 and saliva related transmembrane protein
MTHPLRHHEKPRSGIDKTMIVVSVVSPLFGLPQVLQVYQTQTAAGLSLFSWLAFAGVAFVFLLYALHHNLKPLIIAESLWLAVYIAIIPGILMYA